MSFSYRHRMARRKYGTPGKRKVHVFGAGKLIFPNGKEYAVTGMEVTLTQRPMPGPFEEFETAMTKKINDTFNLRKNKP